MVPTFWAYTTHLSRKPADLQTEEVFDLRGKDGEGDTGGKAHHDGIRDVFNNGTQVQDAHQDEEGTGHESSDHEAAHAILLDDSVNDHNEGAGGATDLHLAATEERNEETGHDGGKNTGLRRGAGSDTECDGQRKGYDAHNDTGQKVLY